MRYIYLFTLSTFLLCCNNQEVTYKSKEMRTIHNYSDNRNNDSIICLPLDLDNIRHHPKKYLQQEDSCISITIAYIEQEFYKGKDIEGMRCFDSLCKYSDGAISELLGNRLFEIYISQPCAFISCFDTDLRYCRRSFAFELLIEELDEKSVEKFLHTQCNDMQKINSFVRKLKNELTTYRGKN